MAYFFQIALWHSHTTEPTLISSEDLLWDSYQMVLINFVVTIVSINDPAATAISRVASPDFLEVKVYLETILKDNDQVKCSSILPIVSFQYWEYEEGQAWLLAWGQSGAGSQGRKRKVYRDWLL